MAFVIVSFNNKNILDTANFASSGLFTAIVCAFASVLILNFFVKRNLVIKLPDGVPTAVNHSFVSLVPGFVILLLFWTNRVPLHFDINVFIQNIFHPLLFAMNSLPGIMFYTLLVSLLWVGGIHGDMTLEGIADPIFNCQCHCMVPSSSNSLHYINRIFKSVCQRRWYRSHDYVGFLDVIF